MRRQQKSLTLVVGESAEKVVGVNQGVEGWVAMATVGCTAHKYTLMAWKCST